MVTSKQPAQELPNYLITILLYQIFMLKILLLTIYYLIAYSLSLIIVSQVSFQIKIDFTISFSLFLLLPIICSKLLVDFWVSKRNLNISLIIPISIFNIQLNFDIFKNSKLMTRIFQLIFFFHLLLLNLLNETNLKQKRLALLNFNRIYLRYLIV